MRTLLVLRHARAESGSESGRDFDRALTDRGRGDAREIGREMRRLGLGPGAVIASPARRVSETLAAVAEGFGPLEVEHDERIYEATGEALLEIVRAADDAAESLLVVGHNPGLQELLLHLTGSDGRGLRDRIRATYQTAALAVVELPANRWPEVSAGTGKVTELVLPLPD